MAVITPTLYIREDGVAIAQWSGITENDTCDPVDMARFPDRTVQAFGDFGGGAVALMGGHDAAELGQLTDNAGTDINMTDNTPVVVAQNPLYTAPDTPDGTSVDLTIVLVGVAR